jgi:16S rRNA (cytosine967-C5)-methyltransferase
VERVCEEHQPLAAVIERFMAVEALALPERDATLARAIARIAIRRRGDVDWCLSALMDRPLPRRAAAARSALRVAAAQLLFMRQAEHAAVNTAVALMKADVATAGFSGLANAVLRRLARERDALLARLPTEANTPAWLWRRWSATYGEDTARAMADVHRQEPGLDIAFAGPVPLPEGAVPLPTGGARLPLGAVSEIEGYAEGTFWVQDMAAQLPALMLGDVAGLTVLDMCAAPGGKTMQLAAGGARVTAVEIDPERAKRLAENLARTRLADRVEVVVADAREVEGSWNAVLLDAPCTATGTLRRQPDAAWNKAPKDLKPLANLQRDLLRKAASVTAPGGRLVYATCSLEAEEGEEQLSFVHRALPSLTVEPIAQPPVNAFATEEGALRTLPHLPIAGTELIGLDGFFAARFRRR